MPELTIDRSRTALLVMDMQNDQVRRMQEAGQEKGIVQRLRRVIEGARRAGVPVIYIAVRFRPGHPEAHPRNPFQWANKQSGRLREGTPDAEIHAEVTPRPDEVVVVKRRVNAFYNTDLDTVLRAQGIETLVLTGIATSGVILSTTRHAADADYALVILEDCCTDADPSVHACLMEKILPRQATIASAEDLLRAIGDA